MILEAAACSDVGLRRKRNEDRHGVAADLGLYLVADGMGGHAAGQVASRLAVEAAVQAVRNRPDAPESLAQALARAVATANRSVFDAAREREEFRGMGTTLVMLLCNESRAALAHVGDSRAYLCRAGRIRQLTDDHSIVAELARRREISADDARAHPHRHVLTRALGVRPSVDPDLLELTMAPGDIFVLCSDGLTNHVEDQEIAKWVSGVADGREPEEVCQGLVDLAHVRGGEDNSTVLLVRCAG
jgi:protein phosphatase